MAEDAATELARAVARTAANAFGGRPEVGRYYDEPETNWVDLLSCRDAPEAGLVSYSTVTLHRAPNFVAGEDVRVELAGVARSAEPAFANALTWIALTIIKDHWMAAPGVVYPNVLQRLELSMSVAHLMLVEPFEWEGLGEVQLVGAPIVHWLHAVPISESEYRFLLEHGFDEILDKLTAADVAYVDMERPSVV